MDFENSTLTWQVMEGLKGVIISIIVGSETQYQQNEGLEVIDVFLVTVKSETMMEGPYSDQNRLWYYTLVNVI